MKTATKYGLAIGTLVLGVVVAGGVYWQVEKLRAEREAESQATALANDRAGELASFDRAQAIFTRILADLGKLIERVRGGHSKFEQADREILLVLRNTIQSASAPRCFDSARAASLTAINAMEQLYRVTEVNMAAQKNDPANDESGNQSLIDTVPHVVAAIGVAQQAVSTACAGWLRGRETPL